MSKSNFLLLDLNDSKTKRLAETITSETSRKILNHLADKADVETNVANELGLPLSTVHYHLQKLQEAGLVTVEEFHYSRKGREMNHYRLANKYIIIAPRHTVGLKEKLRGILPAALISLGVAGGLKVYEIVSKPALRVFSESAPLLKSAAAPMTANAVNQAGFSLSFWFLMGSLAVIAVYLVVEMVREWRK